MSWTLTDIRGGTVAGPFDSAHDAIDSRRSYPYLRLDKLDDGHYDVDAGFSAQDHERYLLIETAA